MQQHGNNFFSVDPIPTSLPIPGWVQKGLGRGQNSAFLEYSHAVYQIKGNDACSKMVATFFRRPHPNVPPWGGFKRSEHGHVAYQIKGNDEYSNMQAHSLSLHTPSNPGEGSKVKTFF